VRSRIAFQLIWVGHDFHSSMCPWGSCDVILGIFLIEQGLPEFAFVSLGLLLSKCGLPELVLIIRFRFAFPVTVPFRFGIRI